MLPRHTIRTIEPGFDRRNAWLMLTLLLALLVACVGPDDAPEPGVLPAAAETGAANRSETSTPDESTEVPEFVDDAEPAPLAVSVDDRLAAMADKIPNFGGLYFDERGQLVVLMVPSEKADSEPELERIEEALAEVFGSSIFFSSQADRREAEEPGPDARRPETRIEEAEYPIADLLRWRDEARPLLSEEGVVSLDLDEARNRVHLVVEEEDLIERLAAAIDPLKIPPGAFDIESGEPVDAVSHPDLRGHHRGVPGGLQINTTGGVGSSHPGWLCTLGFSVQRGSFVGMVTNSHCTLVQGGVEGSQFHQPTGASGGSLPNQVAFEAVDPPYFTGGICPAGRSCRYSDSAFGYYVVPRGFDIARTTGWNNGSIQISGGTTILPIIAEEPTVIMGQELDKVGRTTGWTYGVLDATCVDTNVNGTTFTLLCQNFVDRRQVRTHRMVGPGDSGSPVFRWIHNGGDYLAALSGILWGETDGAATFVYSPLDQLEQELGSLDAIIEAPPVGCEDPCQAAYETCLQQSDGSIVAHMHCETQRLICHGGC